MSERTLDPLHADTAGAIALVAAITPIFAGWERGGVAGAVITAFLLLPTILAVLSAIGPDQQSPCPRSASARLLELLRAVLITNVACLAGLVWICVLAELLVLVFICAVSVASVEMDFLVFPGIVLVTVVWMAGAYWIFLGLDRARVLLSRRTDRSRAVAGG